MCGLRIELSTAVFPSIPFPVETLRSPLPSVFVRLPLPPPHTTHWLMFPTFISGTYWISTQSRIGVFDSFTSTFPCRWALSYCQVYACRLVQCRQLFLNTNQFPSCREHPVSPDLCYWVGIEPTLMDRYGIEPYNMEQRQSYIHKLWPLFASYPLEYYPPFDSINHLALTQDSFIPQQECYLR